MFLNNLLNIENLFLGVLFFGGYISLYSKNILILIFAIALNVFYFFRKTENFYEKSIYFLMFFLPFYTWIRVSLTDLGFSFLAPFFNNIRDFVILIMFVRCLFYDEMKLQSNDYIWYAFAFVWLYGLILTFLFGYPMLGLAGVHLSVVPALLYLTISYSKETYDFEKLEHVFIKVALVVAILGMISFVAKPYHFQSLFLVSGNQTDAMDYIRLVSLFLTPNVCGCYFSIAFSLTLYEFIKKEKFIYLIPGMFFFICIVLTLSRGSWMFVLSAIVLSFFFLRLKSFAGFLVVVVVGFVSSVLIDDFSFNQNVSMAEFAQMRMQTLFDTNSTSSYGRMSSWDSVVEMLFGSPSGLGIGVATTAQISLGAVAQIGVIDGFWAKTIMETGIVGLVYCLMLVGWTYNKIRIFFCTSKMKYGILPLFICSGCFIQSIGSNVLDFICTAPWFWLFLGLTSKKIETQYIQGKK